MHVLIRSRGPGSSSARTTRPTSSPTGRATSRAAAGSCRYAGRCPAVGAHRPAAGGGRGNVDGRPGAYRSGRPSRQYRTGV